ncbi:MAG: UvrB/UvrC motif-containing protein [Gemmatimonadota bacterium]
MKCSQCQQAEAVVHLTQMTDDQVTKVDLCERCAAERGLETASAVGKTPLASYIAAMGQGINDTVVAGDLAFVCRTCGATLQDFRESGRLGCPQCYRTLGEPLRELLRRLHGATRHTGERYQLPGQSQEPGRPEPGHVKLREQLKQAIESENFELAAQLRDKLKVNE